MSNEFKLTLDGIELVVELNETNDVKLVVEGAVYFLSQLNALILAAALQSTVMGGIEG